MAWLALASVFALRPLAAQTTEDGWPEPLTSRGAEVFEPVFEPEIALDGPSFAEGLSEAVRKGGLAPGSCGLTCEWPHDGGCLSPFSNSLSVTRTLPASGSLAGTRVAREVLLNEADGEYEPLVRASSGPLGVLHFPLLTEAAELNLTASSLLGALPRFFGRIRGEYADDFVNQTRIGGSAHLRATPVYGFDIEWHHRRQHRQHRPDDRLWTGDANFVYQLINVKMISMRAGGGVAWLAEDGRGQVGYNLTYGADFFLRRPWLMTLEFDTGRISGNSLYHARGTVGYVVGQIEFYTGWDWYKLGDRAFDGLIGGVTLWF